jgi:excisionase family DNA binding protein
MSYDDMTPPYPEPGRDMEPESLPDLFADVSGLADELASHIPEGEVEDILRGILVRAAGSTPQPVPGYGSGSYVPTRTSEAGSLRASAEVATMEAGSLLTPAEVATMFRVDPKTVTRWAKAGKLTSLRTLGGHRRYRETEVRALLAGIPQQRSE